MTEDKTVPDENQDVIGLKKKIIRQVEFYFGDYNLIKDKFMKEQMKENEGWFNMDVMLQFKRLASICSEPTTILEALSDADKSLLEIDSQNQRIRRRPNRKIPVDNEEYRKGFNARTVHVKGFQSEESIDDIHEFLSTYGKVAGIQLQRLSDKKFKGSLFVTFCTQEDADKFIGAPMVYYKTDEITKISRAEFYKQLDEEKKNKKQKNNQNDQLKDQRPTVALKVAGITDDTIDHRDIKEVFGQKGMKNVLFFDRNDQHSEEGYVIFQSEDEPESILKESGFDDGSKATVKSAEVCFSKPTDEELENIMKRYAAGRERHFSRSVRPGKRSKPFRRHGGKKEMGKKTKFESDEEDEVKEPNQKAAKLE